jgi:Helix-turn-helix domain
VTGRSALADWRNAVRDSNLDTTAKTVAFVLSTYMDRAWRCFPGQDTLARGCSLSDTAVRGGTRRLEQAGFLAVEWSKGRSPHRYFGRLPNPEDSSEFNGEAGSGLCAPTPKKGRFNSEVPAANPEADALNPEGASDESTESNFNASEGLEGGPGNGHNPEKQEPRYATPAELQALLEDLPAEHLMRDAIAARGARRPRRFSAS